jgi:uncharacterized repeat protein (TIGR01451 family)
MSSFRDLLARLALFVSAPYPSATDIAVLVAATGILLPTPVASATSAVWRVSVTSQPTNFVSGDPNNGSYPLYSIVAINVGGAPAAGPITITDILPAGITATAATFQHNNGTGGICPIGSQTITCVDPEPLGPGQVELMEVRVAVGTFAEGQTVTNQAKISSAGALDASAATTTTIASSLPDFGFLPGPNGISASLSDLDGFPITQAGSHPDQLTINLGLPSRRLEGERTITGIGGGLRDLRTDLPRGFLGNPTATAELCTEAQLESHKCPNESAVGLVTVLTTGAGTPQPSESSLYNMVPPPGAPAAFGFDAANVGLFVHLKAEVRSDGDYGISASTNDILARAPNPVLAAQAQIWGDPSDPSHDGARGACGEPSPPSISCPVEPQQTAFLTLPSACSSSYAFGAAADSWLEPGSFRSASAPITDAAGNPTGVTGCNKLHFEPSIEAKPTTNLTDSPSGLDVDLHQPQENKLGGLATANLKDATITLPEGLVVNPSQADGLAACSAEQVGLSSKVGETPIRFSKAPASCPDAAKLASVSVSTPAVAHPLPGAIYIAKPFQNPFGSLLAIYLVIDDPQSGVIAKLAGKVHANPATGQLSTTFTENPELPVEDFQVHFFTGPRAALRTPPACDTYTTQADLTPWSSPEGADAHPTDSFALTAAPGGGPCPAAAADAPNQPSFSAGTIDPQAGAYTPFAMKLVREDGSQPPAGLEITLPPGLIGKAAGIPYCPESGIARAQARHNPNEGAIEQADPSCPAASEVGTVDAGVGAGPTPFHTTGRVYFAGPYKGAPISVVTITPAVAGPFDLGAVVIRAAAYLDPERAQIRVLTDPLPTILEGIPLDLRSVAVRLGRPSFTLNPTNCDPMSIEAKLTSVFGQIVPLSNRFQVGGCNALGFKPRLGIRLKGKTKRTGHPALTGVFRPKAADANAKRLSVALPRSEFLDQAHIGTVCTRVQFAANQCPAASVYGRATAITPLLDQPLKGPVYLRSSSHELPDVVIALHGQVDAVLDGRVDSVNGGIRVTFEGLPDAPVTKAVVQMKGGKKGLLINSANLCKLAPAATRATVKMEGQNGKRLDASPVVQSDCAKGPSHKKKKSGHR